MSPQQFEVSPSVDADVQEFVFRSLREYNHSADSEFFERREQPENKTLPMCVATYDPSGRVVGGLLAETQFAWLKISVMAVSEGDRRQGRGKQLVALAEAEAVRRGCTMSYVDTMSYQAPEFYEALGYETAGRLPNWDSHGHDKLLMVKRLS